MTISAATRRVQYSGSAGTGPYSFSFEVLAQTDIDVYLNTTLLTITTDYTVSLNGSGSGTVTLVVAATGSDVVTLISSMSVARAADYVTGGDLLANTLNDEQDSMIIFVQQLEEQYDRVLNVAPTDTATSLTLPTATARASKYLAFDSSGNPVATSTTSVITTAFIDTLIDDTTAAEARTTLGARGESEDVTLAAGKVIIFEGTTADAHEATLTAGDPTADRTITLPDATTTLSGLDVAQTFTKGQRGEVTALTSTAASIAIDLADSNNFSHTLTENTTLAAPSNPVAGQSGVITFTQHASSPKTLAYNSFWKFQGGTVPALTATNSAVDVFTYYVNSASFATCQLIKGVA